VRASTVIVFSGSEAFLTPLGPLKVDSPTRCSLAFTLKDINGNPLPAGTELSVSNITGGGAPDAESAGFGMSGDKVPNTSAAGPTQHSAVFTKCTNPSSLSFKLSVKTPKGKVTPFFLP
jgi:hypothetical protein